MKEDDTSSFPTWHLPGFKNAKISVHFLDFRHPLLVGIVNGRESLDKFITDTLSIEMAKPEANIFNGLYSIKHKQVPKKINNALKRDFIGRFLV